MKYRPEIDGLRAVAVVPVILFHAGIAGASGGFVGVDIFFVISGYLISTIILAEIDKGNFSIARFYERRARRILPALFAVIAACVPFAISWMLPAELEDFGRSLVASALFASNALFWRETGYFAPRAEEMPLLHTWSLAVEEQFYILYPLALVLIAIKARKSLPLAVLLIGVFSLCAAHYFAFKSPAANFYLLPSRAFELAIGAGCAIFLFNKKQAGTYGPIASAAALIGLAMIAFSIVLFDETTPFPSLFALIPTLGTALIILFASPATIAGRTLTLRPLVMIGLVSYSAYLWHFPLFAFARIRMVGDLPPLLVWTLVISTLLLAAASYRIVERPFRRQDRFSRTQIMAFSGAGMSVLVSVGVFFVLSAGWPQRIAAEHRIDMMGDAVSLAGYVEGSYKSEVQDKPFVEGKPGLLIIGDSFSQDFYNMIRETGAFPGFQVSAIFVPTVCQLAIVPAEELPRAASPAGIDCAAQRDKLHDPRIGEADVVVIAARWTNWSVALLSGTIDSLDLKDGAEVYVLGPKEFPPSRRFMLFYPDRNWQPTPEIVAMNGSLGRNSGNARFVDLMDAYCAAGTGCPVEDRYGKALSHDGGHLTQAGASFLGDRLFERTILSKFRPTNRHGQLSIHRPEHVSGYNVQRPMREEFASKNDRATERPMI